MVVHSQLISCSASEVAAMIGGDPARHPEAVDGNYVDSDGQSDARGRAA